MQKIVIIELSLVEEDMEITNAEIVKDISDAFSNGDVCIPWCNKVEKITLT
jgi:hypothetical protein